LLLKWRRATEDSMNLFGLFAVLALTLAGCANDPASRAKELAAQVQVGTTTKAEVLELFGFPTTQKKTTNDGRVQEVWTYVFMGQGKAPSNGLTVTLDENGVVSAITPNQQLIVPDAANSTRPPLGGNPKPGR
jgi:outer membrane protein assembly factor BamE (lipoprotein component of BamABCDE complex)